MRPSIKAARRLAIAITAVAALAAPAVATTTASAGTAPVPATVAAVQAEVAHARGLAPEFFTIRIVNNGPGQVWAYGPVSGYATDNEISNTQGVFTFGDSSTVNVAHTDVSNVSPRVNYRACTATASTNGYWAFLGGTRRYRNALGAGTFRISLFLQLKRLRNGRCDLNMNDQPAYSLVSVTASGKARW
jgi:hypothetical protein